MANLLDPFNVNNRLYDDAFKTWYAQHWLVKNNGSSLRATPENIERGAFLEWQYLQRGAKEDARPFCDVLVSGISVDCKISQVKTTRQTLFKFKERYIREKHAFFVKHKIQEVHWWSDSVTSSIATPWFRYIVSTKQFLPL